jgi:hypothetical protein
MTTPGRLVLGVSRRALVTPGSGACAADSSRVHRFSKPGSGRSRLVRLLSDLHDSLRNHALDADESLALVTELAQQAK